MRENKTNGLERLALQNFSLGIDPNAEFKVLEHSLNPGDTILMHSFGFVSDAPHSEFNNSDLEQSILQCLEMSPQGQVESIFQKKKQTVQKSVIERPIMIMSIQRGA